MSTMSSIPEELSSLITCYLKPKDVFQLVEECCVCDDSHEMIKDIINTKMQNASTHLMTLEKNCNDEWAILNIKHSGESFYKIKRSDFLKIKDGAKFVCDDIEMKIDGTEIQVQEYISLSQAKYCEDDNFEWFPESMRDNFFENVFEPEN